MWWEVLKVLGIVTALCVAVCAIGQGMSSICLSRVFDDNDDEKEANKIKIEAAKEKVMDEVIFPISATIMLVGLTWMACIIVSKMGVVAVAEAIFEVAGGAAMLFIVYRCAMNFGFRFFVGVLALFWISYHLPYFFENFVFIDEPNPDLGPFVHPNNTEPFSQQHPHNTFAY